MTTERPQRRWAPLYGRWFKGARLGLILLLAQGIGLTVIGLVATRLGPREPFRGNWDELVIQGGGLFAQVEANWQRWDALWYQHIATAGYGPADGTSAFYPLYPFLARLMSTLTGDIVRAELVVSGVAFVCAVALLWRLTRLEVIRRMALERRRRPAMVATLAVLTTAFFPSGYFLFAPYTEGLFLCFTLAAFWFARTGRPWAAGLAGSFASLTRAQGALLVLPLAFEQAGAAGLLQWIRRRGGSPPSPVMLASFLPLAGTAVFAAVQATLAGGEIGAGSQAPWGITLVLPWQAVPASIEYIGRYVGEPNGWVELLNLGSLVGGLAVAAIALRRLPPAYAIYGVASLGLLLFRTAAFSPLMSVSRFLLVVFPCSIVVAMWLDGRPRLAAAWLLVGLGVQVAFYQYWVRWGFVG